MSHRQTQLNLSIFISDQLKVPTRNFDMLLILEAPIDKSVVFPPSKPQNTMSKILLSKEKAPPASF